MPVSRRDADPILQRMIEWRKDPTAEATVKLCETLRAERAPIAREEVAYISTTVARLHRGNLEVLRSLGLLQLARGLIDEARVTFVRIADAERLPPPPFPPAKPRLAIPSLAPPQIVRKVTPGEDSTSAHRPPEMLLAALCVLDDDKALAQLVNPPDKKVAPPGSALIATAPNKPARPPLPPPRPPPRKASRSGRSSDSSPPSR